MNIIFAAMSGLIFFVHRDISCFMMLPTDRPKCLDAVLGWRRWKFQQQLGTRP